VATTFTEIMLEKKIVIRFESNRITIWQHRWARASLAATRGNLG
jgi:hypothetical protein